MRIILSRHYQKLVLGFFMSLWPHLQAIAYTDADMQKLRNDKEVSISSFKAKDIDMIKLQFPDQSFNQKIISLAYSSIRDFLNEAYPKCELALVGRWENRLKSEQIPHSEQDIEAYLKILRINNSIDDILYEILSGTNKDFFALRSLKLDALAGTNIFPSSAALERNDVKKLFVGFTNWPDENERCVYQEFVNLKRNIRMKKDSEFTRDRYLKTLTHEALRGNLIDLATFNKLEYLRKKSPLTRRDIWLKDYFKIIFSAKNKMVPLSHKYQIKDISTENTFPSEKIKRLSNLTRRKVLYRKYDETQIIMLAKILQKASQRMGVDPDTETKLPFIGQEFSILKENGERETYVEKIELDPQSQYNLARRLLRKDLTELQMMDTFNKVDITYSDIVMAAFETGYVSFEDIEFVVKYDDLWNPERTSFQKIMGFVFTTAGYGTFFLPPPWNLYTSLALTIVEGIIDDKTREGSSNDNPATFIE